MRASTLFWQVLAMFERVKKAGVDASESKNGWSIKLICRAPKVSLGPKDQ